MLRVYNTLKDKEKEKDKVMNKEQLVKFLKVSYEIWKKMFYLQKKEL